MSHVDFTLMQGDQLPLLAVTLTDSSGDALDLTNSTVTFTMKAEFDRIDKRVNAPAVITNAAAGEVQYEWAVGDTDTPGVYRAHFTVADVGKELSVPSDGYFLIEVLKDRTA